MTDQNELKQTHQELQKEESPTPEGVERTQQATIYRPHADIIDSETEVVLRVNLPGVNEDRTDLTLEKNVLTIRGRAEVPHYEGFELAYGEYGVGDFERSFKLSDEIDRDKIEASVKQGVLTVHLPKVKTAQKQKITVSAG
jgi:HSP20 family molecular chaperone IbpA